MARGTTYFSDELGREWDDETLWKAAENEKSSILEIQSLRDLETINSLVDDFIRIQEILDKLAEQPPIILTPDGHIADGFHRCAAQVLARGKLRGTKIEAVTLKEMPPADRVKEPNK